MDGIAMSFDVKKGFTVCWPWASLPGSLFCSASLGVWRQISTKYMLIHVSCVWAWGLGGRGNGETCLLQGPQIWVLWIMELYLTNQLSTTPHIVNYLV